MVMVKMTKSKQPHPNKQRVPTQLKSDDKDDKDLLTHRPEQGVPKSGEGFIDFIGQVGQTPKGNLFLLI